MGRRTQGDIIKMTFELRNRNDTSIACADCGVRLDPVIMTKLHKPCPVCEVREELRFYKNVMDEPDDY